MTTTYWHCADSDYAAGEDLLSTEAMLDRGWTVEDKWTDNEHGDSTMDPADYAVVSLWRDGERDSAAWMLANYPGLILVRVDLPDDMDVILNAESNAAVARMIPAEYVTIVDPSALAE